MHDHRPAAVAGLFYPSDPAALRAEVEARLAAAEAVAERPTASGALRAPPGPPATGGTGGTGGTGVPKLIVVPHAGHVYSGDCAARAYALLAPARERIRRVVLLGPTHRVAVRGIAVPRADAFDTPLGAVPLDRAAIDALAGLPQVVASDRVHAQEHAIEVQLPFLQVALGRFTLVPLAVGDATPDEVAEVLERLWGGDETLVAISTDLSHFLPDDRARALDARTLARVLRLDGTIGHDEACGATPLAGALRAARAHGLEPTLLDARTSADASGDRSRVVGYASIAFRPRPAPAHSDRPSDGADGGAVAGASHADSDSPEFHSDPDLQFHSDPDLLGRALIARARNAIADALGVPDRLAEPPHPALAEPGASFVTLHRRGALRGCVGRVEPDGRPLGDDVRGNARRAAFDDPRFAPLTAAEWPDLEVEVSVLGPVEPLPATTEAEALAALRPGVDGVVLESGGRRATFLPQVWAQLPEPRDFLAALRHKAGLPPGAWPRGTTLGRYRVVGFDEHGDAR